MSRHGCALVTGASRGIGAAIAKGLAADGWPVMVNYRMDSAAAAAVVEAIEQSGGRAATVRGDVSDPGVAQELTKAVEAEFGMPPLVLVNNAGITRDRLVPQLDDERWDAVMATNLSAVFRLSRQVLRPMMRARFGRIVNVASVVGRLANPGQSAYAASKAGLVAFTRTLAVEVARLGITANAVAPGLVETDATQDVVGKLTERVPIGRPGRPEEIAACVRFLASRQASYVTGAVLTVDGGLGA